MVLKIFALVVFKMGVLAGCSEDSIIVWMKCHTLMENI